MALVKATIHRSNPRNDADFFPTPPWATRALFEYVLVGEKIESVWDPACGAGHMAKVIEEYVPDVRATDLYDYGFGGVGVDFLQARPTEKVEWIICNPPFNKGLDFALKALSIAQKGVCILARTQWVEGKDRFERLFSIFPPAVVATFVERVAMTKGRWDPEATSALSYSWFWWNLPGLGVSTKLTWIPPCKDTLTRPEDIVRFAGIFEAAESPLAPIFGD